MRNLRWISIVLLVLGAAGLGYKLRADWSSFRQANDPAVIKSRPVPPAQAPVATMAPDYGVVAQQNPFHPDRNDALPPPPPVAAKVTGPPPLVYGSMLLGKERFALMATENDTKPRKVTEGEEFQGYKLAEIKQQSVVLEADGAKNEVMFYNALSRLRREAQRSQTTQPNPPATATTVNASAAGPAGGAPPVPEPGALPPAVAGSAGPPGTILGRSPFGS